MNLVAAHTINILLQPTQLILLQGTLLEDTSCSYQIKYNSFPCETPQFLALARKRPKYKSSLAAGRWCLVGVATIGQSSIWHQNKLDMSALDENMMRVCVLWFVAGPWISGPLVPQLCHHLFRCCPYRYLSLVMYEIDKIIFSLTTNDASGKLTQDNKRWQHPRTPKREKPKIVQ